MAEVDLEHRAVSEVEPEHMAVAELEPDLGVVNEMHETLQNLLLHWEVDLGPETVFFESPSVYKYLRDFKFGKKEL